MFACKLIKYSDFYVKILDEIQIRTNMTLIYWRRTFI